VEISTKQGYGPVVAPDVIRAKLRTDARIMDIPDIHNLQITGNINDRLPPVRGLKSFELMCTSQSVDWNEEGIGNRKIYKVERLQQAFSRLATGSHGVLKP